MSRYDQWIGLTKKGDDWFAKQKNVYRTKKPIGNYAFDIPDEIYGKEVKIDDVIYREHIQADPWSSGPMYFTDVEIIKNGITIGYMFSWKYDAEEYENHNYEYNYEAGTFDFI